MHSSYLAKIIRTDSGNIFVYDGLTSKIISIDRGESSRKKFLSELTKEIFPELFRRGLLQQEQFKSAQWNVSFGEYKNFLENSLPALILQITRSCNLACGYCVYSGKYLHVRPTANDDMSSEIIRRSIDFYAAHSGKVPVRRISFYGGEPLLRFSEIKKAVSYAEKVFSNKPFNVSVSTNGILLGKNVFDWMKENPNVKIVITLNGTFQDKYRRTLGGAGTFETVIAKLSILRESYPDLWGKQIAFIANYVSLTEIADIFTFYERLGVTEQPLFLTSIRRDLANEEIQQMLKTDNRKETSARKALQKNFRKNPNGIIKNFLKSDLETLDERKIFNADDAMQIASCMPFAVKLFVRTDGKFNLCERTSDALILGDLDNGFYEETISQVMYEVEKLITNTCRDCWSQRICMICFQNLVDENGEIRKKIPSHICKSMRRNLYELLKIYCEVYG